MALPNWAGNTRYIGPTGPAGPSGSEAASGGQLLYLDSATSTTVPTLGNLLLIPVLTSQTTISYTASSSTVLIARFPTPVGALVSTFIPPGVWGLNIFARSSATTNAPAFYWSLYQVDADGVSNPVLIKDGSADPVSVTSTTDTVYTSTESVPAYTLTDTTKRFSIYLYGVYDSGSRTLTFAFRGNTQAFLNTTLGDIPYAWSTQPAISSVNLQNYNISNIQTLSTQIISNTSNISTSTIDAVGGTFTTLSGTLTGNVTGNLTGNVVGNISNTNLTVSGQFSINEVADVGSAVSNYASYGTVNITGKGGLGGIVNITADVATPLNPAVTVSQLTAEAKGNFGLITPGSPVGYVPRGGLVSIIARQGLTPSPPAEVTSALFANGEIDLTAYSYGIVPGLIKLSAGANEIYAGAFTPVTGVIGYNYIFGQFGNNITAGLPPGGIPTVPGENYIYGLNGTVIDNGLYTDTIYNKFGGDLNLNSRTCNMALSTALVGGRSITLTSLTIGIAGTMNLSNNAISNCTSLSSASALTLNADPFSNIILNANEAVLNGNVNMCNKILFNVSNIQANSNLVLSSTTGGNIVLSNIGFLNMNGFSISNVNTVAGCNVTVTTSGNLTIKSSTGGQVVCSNDLNMSNNNIINVANIFATAGSNLTISNDDHFITLPPPGITYATGGTITQSGGRTFHTFTSNGFFDLLVGVGTVEVMVIGGGGGGGGVNGGGGGAGNMAVVESVLALASYTVTVGGGGAGGTTTLSGIAGDQSQFTNGGSINIRGLGGGGGSTFGSTVGGNGGCGGGGSAGTESAGGTAGTGSTTGMTSLSNVAFAGGSNPNPGNAGPAGSGGGGVASVGVDVSAITPADGGDGGGALLYRGTYYGGGGGGAACPTGAYGTPTKGRGGGQAPPVSGGNGSLAATSTQAEPGVANTGGGGGGGEDAFTGYAGAAGGSGVVIVSYVTPTPPQMTLGTSGEILMDAPSVVISNDLTIGGTTNLGLVNISNLNVDTITASSNAEFNGTTTAITGKLVGQNNKPIAIVTGVATGFWNPTTVGTVTTSGAASFSNVDNPSGFAVADFNAYMSLLSFNNLNATDFYLSDQRIQQNSSGTYWSADCDAVAYSPNVYLSNQNTQWIVNAIFIPKSLSS